VFVATFGSAGKPAASRDCRSGTAGNSRYCPVPTGLSNCGDCWLRDVMRSPTAGPDVVPRKRQDGNDGGGFDSVRDCWDGSEPAGHSV